MKRGVILPALLASVMLSGCGMNYINLDRYPPQNPLVIVSDGLNSGDARRFMKRICDEEKIPYIGEDNISWFKNKQAIEDANKQGRGIILVGYSAGCDQVRMTEEWCEEKKIPVWVIFFDPSYLQGRSEKTVHGNVREVKNYLSDRNVPDLFSIYGKGRELLSEDLENPKTSYNNIKLRGPHLGIFDNNRDTLEKDIKSIIQNCKK